MADTIQHFYAKLVDLPQIRKAILDEFGQSGPTIIQAMVSGTSLDPTADDLEELVVRIVSENASVIAEFEASGKASCDPEISRDYLQQHHPEALALIDKMGGAPGFEQSDFFIQVLRYEFLFIVATDDFENAFFDRAESALTFAKSNYAPFLKGRS